MRFEQELDHLLSLHDKMVCAEIDAGACQTDSDRRRAREAADKFEEAYDRFLVRYKDANPSAQDMEVV